MLRLLRVQAVPEVFASKELASMCPAYAISQLTSTAQYDTPTSVIQYDVNKFPAVRLLCMAMSLSPVLFAAALLLRSRSTFLRVRVSTANIKSIMIQVGLSFDMFYISIPPTPIHSTFDTDTCFPVYGLFRDALLQSNKEIDALEE
ncbi:hypothetical protein NMY22_g2112 [Coprinellus aureogranulatus]|nr:hypothetical protein NMY22_g2112 [Coprinellus aureogranulatus]